MKHSDSLPQYRDTLLEVLQRVEVLRVRSAAVEPARVEASFPPADLCVDVSVSGDDWILVAECKNVGHPGTVRTALLQLQSYLGALPGRTKRYGVFAAPFVSPASADLCRDAGMGYVDL